MCTELGKYINKLNIFLENQSKCKEKLYKLKENENKLIEKQEEIARLEQEYEE